MNDPTVHSHVASIDPEGDIDDAESLNFGSVDADSLIDGGLEFAPVKVRVSTDESLTDTRARTARVDESGDIFLVDVGDALGTIPRFGIDRL